MGEVKQSTIRSRSAQLIRAEQWELEEAALLERLAVGKRSPRSREANGAVGSAQV
jgi:hypothetical protein